MSSCCENSLDNAVAHHGSLTVALAGNPNSGKTTIFNALTGLRQKVANYPGVTVEKKTGRCKLSDGTSIDVIDLPGTYSLVSRSPDELVAMQVLRGLRADTKTPDAVVVVVDASNLQRNLYLVSQLIELGRPLVIALNMMDVAERRGLKISPEALARELGVPVIPVVGHKRLGIDALKAAIRQAAVAPLPNWPLPDVMREEVQLVGGGLAILGSGDGDGNTASDAPANLHDYQAVAERLLIGDRADDLAELASREPVASLLHSASSRLTALGVDPMQADVEAHYRWIEAVAHRVAAPVVDISHASAIAENGSFDSASPRPPSLTERVDAVLVHRVWGLVIFAAIMTALFVSIFWLASPIMDAMNKGISALGGYATHRLADGPIKDLLTQGVFAGVGTVIVFVPQIALLFFFLAILEDSGYLARAAFLMDRLLSKVGLHGKSFIPLLSSFACAIPGIMATRTIENRKDRLATILVAPFMSCSARLPVYTLLIGTFFARRGPLFQAGIMLACYALGILAAVVTALIFRRTFLKGMPTSFILEMPTYKVPQASIVVRQVVTNAGQFLKKAGTTIFAMSVILWALAYYPRLPKEKADAAAATGAARFDLDAGAKTQDGTHAQSATDIDAERQHFSDDAVAAAQSEYSVAGRFGHAIAPVIRPLGFNWKMGVGLVAAFAAREVFVSTEGIVYATGDTEEAGTTKLSDAMRADRHSDGSPVWTPLVAVSLLVWFVLAMQCMSTVAIVRRETGGWGWPIFMIVYMNALAYIVSLLVFQVGSRLA